MRTGLYKIGQVAELSGLSIDTLRYYERIGLLHGVQRTAGGARRYSDDDLATLAFIRRAQKMNFSLNEISELLNMRSAPKEACDEARKIAQQKLSDVNQQIEELLLLREELQGLISGCTSEQGECAFLAGIEHPPSE